MKRGFTLIEMIVAIGIFMIVMLLGMTAVLSTLDANRKSQSSNLVMSNLSLAVEAMSRDIRVGTNYKYGSHDISIKFTRSDGETQAEYFYDSNAKAIMRTTFDTNGNEDYTGPVTAPEVEIDDVRFRLGPEGVQPSVLLLIKGKAGVKADTISEFYLQSTISQRLTPTL